MRVLRVVFLSVEPSLKFIVGTEHAEAEQRRTVVGGVHPGASALASHISRPALIGLVGGQSRRPEGRASGRQFERWWEDLRTGDVASSQKRLLSPVTGLLEWLQATQPSNSFSGLVIPCGVGDQRGS